MTNPSAALQSVIEWTGDNHGMPDAMPARCEWYARRLLMIRNAARAGLQSVYFCPLCGQRIDDGKPCGCGAR